MLVTVYCKDWCCEKVVSGSALGGLVSHLPILLSTTFHRPSSYLIYEMVPLPNLVKIKKYFWTSKEIERIVAIELTTISKDSLQKDSMSFESVPKITC